MYPPPYRILIYAPADPVTSLSCCLLSCIHIHFIIVATVAQDWVGRYLLLNEVSRKIHPLFHIYFCLHHWYKETVATIISFPKFSIYIFLAIKINKNMDFSMILILQMFNDFWDFRSHLFRFKGSSLYCF